MHESTHEHIHTITMFTEMQWGESELFLAEGGAFEKRENGALFRARGVAGEPGFFVLIRVHPDDPAEIASFTSMADLVAMMDRQGGVETWHKEIEGHHNHEH